MPEKKDIGRGIKKKRTMLEKSKKRNSLKKANNQKGENNMKKLVCVLTLICLLLVSLSAASAQTVEPLMPERLRELVAGKTFIARMEGLFIDEEMEYVTLFFQVCEQETYPAAEVEALQVGDIIVIGGDPFEIKKISQDENGYEMTGEYYSIYLYKNDEGFYYAVTDTENRFYKNVFAFEIPAPATLRFLDWSDPDAEAPTVLTVKDLVNKYMNEEIHSTEDNTEITFDADGNLSEIVYRYSPWN